jgi:hypothetical protein
MLINHLKPFDLNEALLNRTAVTRKGKEVTQLTLFESKSDFPLYGVIDEQIYSWNKVGSSKSSPDLDLFLEPEIKKGWLLKYGNDTRLVVEEKPFLSSKDDVKYYYPQATHITRISWVE